MQVGTLVCWGGGSSQLPLGPELGEGRLCSPGILAHAIVFILVPLPSLGLSCHLIISQGLGTSAVHARRPCSDDALAIGVPSLSCS